MKLDAKDIFKDLISFSHRLRLLIQEYNLIYSELIMNIDNPLEVLGHTSWLWVSSPLHRNWSVSLFAISVLPAIRVNQYALLTRDNCPITYCSWANLSLGNEIKYLNDITSLVAGDWTLGDRKWFIDWIVPLGDDGALYKYMQKKFPDELFRAIRVDPKIHAGKVSKFHGGRIDKQLANKILKQCHHELITKVKNRVGFNFLLTG